MRAAVGIRQQVAVEGRRVAHCTAPSSIQAAGKGRTRVVHTQDCSNPAAGTHKVDHSLNDERSTLPSSVQR